MIDPLTGEDLGISENQDLPLQDDKTMLISHVDSAEEMEDLWESMPFYYLSDDEDEGRSGTSFREQA